MGKCFKLLLPSLIGQVSAADQISKALHLCYISEHNLNIHILPSRPIFSLVNRVKGFVLINLMLHWARAEIGPKNVF